MATASTFISKHGCPFTANIIVVACCLLFYLPNHSQSLSINPKRISDCSPLPETISPEISRRDAITSPFRSSAALVIGSSALAMPANGKNYVANAASNGLAAKLSQRDPSALKNSVFNIPPPAQIYPPFMHGRWEVTMKFRGFLFPSTLIPKEKLISNASIPGFQKCSIASVCDVGREETRYLLDISEKTGLEDRQLSFQSSIDAHLGYPAVREVIYDPSANPNRISIDFIPNRTRNANRIELFCNARESELVSSNDGSPSSIFVCSEYIRQVTFGLSQEFGVARQVVGNYAHFWTWREGAGNVDSSSAVTGNLLTAAYLDPQDSMFFQEPSKPVAVYSHDLVARRM